MRIKRRAKNEVRNDGCAVSGSFIVTNFPFELKNPTPEILSTQKIKSRIEIAAASAFCPAIAVLVSKSDATVETKSLMEIDGEFAKPRI